jgi:hypothetical protein
MRIRRAIIIAAIAALGMTGVAAAGAAMPAAHSAHTHVVAGAHFHSSPVN